MTVLYLVRHGQTDWNKENRCQGRIDTELNSEGILQAEAIAQRLAGENIDVIYSSALKRAYTTAEIINRKLSRELVRNEALNEIDFGEWEGLTFEEMRKRPDYSYEQWRLMPHLVTFPGGEKSLKNVQDRAMKFVNEIIEKHNGNNILIVSHGGVIKLIILGMLGIGLEAYNKFFIANASLSIVVIESDRAFLRTLNDTCHIKNLITAKS
ncbi:Phosphoglycerate mutase [Acetivibrio thermocellus DSM 1313]|uniref:Phosphoglycerate mutase n=1 Tax=Acetivibrio thermocellus (strain ATCC 27405 / DSM 1237 / JCM 9322 / NBRC 103400 / NCIMB 10682 / NRRL B-4536 / VPI 7372) TaxID=203119 RepID=A3DDB3_ACET2|nr:Phosphoglycerate mutase [Acetivibrio thermocellus ATCC 27405]ADU74579.1 Phosphoglycerate mutase [Acetivibrio thermocellus DSM 1313]